VFEGEPVAERVEAGVRVALEVTVSIEVRLLVADELPVGVPLKEPDWDDVRLAVPVCELELVSVIVEVEEAEHVTEAVPVMAAVGELVPV
jgi:hypothetical protein